MAIKVTSILMVSEMPVPLLAPSLQTHETAPQTETTVLTMMLMAMESLTTVMLVPIA